LFALTTVLAFFDYFSGQTVTAFGFTVVIAPIFAAVLCFVVTAAFFATVSVTLDVLLVDAYLRTIGQSAGLYSFDLYTAHKTSINLWGSAITPKYFGPVSARGHHWAFATIGLTLIPVILMFALFPTVVCGLVAYQFLQNDQTNWNTLVFVAASVLMLVSSWIFILLFALKYKFQPADFRESDQAPTAEFVEKLNKEHAQKTVPRDSDGKENVPQTSDNSSEKRAHKAKRKQVLKRSQK
jgi:hypothetical protein